MIALMPVVIPIGLASVDHDVDDFFYLEISHALPGSLKFLYPNSTEISRPHKAWSSCKCCGEIAPNPINSCRIMRANHTIPRPLSGNYAHHQNRKAINVAVWWSIPSKYQRFGTFQHFPPLMSLACHKFAGHCIVGCRSQLGTGEQNSNPHGVPPNVGPTNKYLN